ncbi:hypothetical protein BZG36_05443, partial [Bifiguratus adelaidae]
EMIVRLSGDELLTIAQSYLMSPSAVTTPVPSTFGCHRTSTAGLGNPGWICTVNRRREHEQVLTGSYLLAATGRTSNADTLDLGFIGVAIDQHGFINVNDRLATNVAGIYAMGDGKGGPQFTHISYDDFRIPKTNIWRRERQPSRVAWYPILSL